MIDLNILWFVLIAVLFTGFFILEGFDFGVGMLYSFVGKNDTEKRMLLNSIGPVWDSNEVWLLTAGGAIFAAFPGWYATMFSGMYLALFLVLVGLIVRVVGFEFRSKIDNPVWKKSWDICIIIGSFLPPLLLAVGMANLIKGLPIDANKEFVGTFFDLLSVPTLVTGLAAVAVFLYHGAVYLSMKTEGEMNDRFIKVSRVVGLVAIVLGLATAVLGATSTDVFAKSATKITTGLAVVSILISYILQINKKSGTAFIFNVLAIGSGAATLFAGLFPRVMVSSLDAMNSLTIYTISSTPYTLNIMSIVALTILPVVLIYLGWTYWIFRGKVSSEHLEY